MSKNMTETEVIQLVAVLCEHTYENRCDAIDACTAIGFEYREATHPVGDARAFDAGDCVATLKYTPAAVHQWQPIGYYLNRLRARTIPRTINLTVELDAIGVNSTQLADSVQRQLHKTLPHDVAAVSVYVTYDSNRDPNYKGA